MPKKPNPIDLGFLQGEAARTDLSGMFAASIAGESEMQQAVMVKIDRLLDNPYQPRDGTPDAAIVELARVIKSQGFQGVLIARPDPADRGFYQLTAGHRRREAARLAGLSTLPVVARDLTDEEMVTLAITENIQREDLSPLEEGRIYVLMISKMGYTHEQVAREIGKTRGYVENRIRVAKAPPDVRALVQARPDTLRAVSYLVKVKDDRERGEIIEQIMKSTLTADDVPGFIMAQKNQVTLGVVQGALADVKQLLREERASRAEAGVRGQGSGIRDRKPETDPRSLTPDPLSRVGNAKLQTVLRYLKNYKAQSANRERISAEEQANLTKIKALVEELYDVHNSHTQ